MPSHSLQSQFTVLYNQGKTCREIELTLGISNRQRRKLSVGLNTRRKNRYLVNSKALDVIDTPAKAYVLGLMAADGCVTKVNQIILQCNDADIVKFVATTLEYTGEVREVVREKYDSGYRINFSDKGLADRFRSYGIVENKSRIFQNQYHGQFYNSFLLGYLDGDGCVYKNPGRNGGLVSIIGSQHFCEEVRSKLNCGSVSIHNKSSMYYWRVFGRKDFLFLKDFLYKDLCILNRKYNKLVELCNYENSQKRVPKTTICL